MFDIDTNGFDLTIGYTAHNSKHINIDPFINYIIAMHCDKWELEFLGSLSLRNLIEYRAAEWK